MASAREHAQLGAFAQRDGGEEARALDLGSPDLEMRIARAAERAGAEQRAAEVGAPAAAAREHALWRMVERAVRGVEHSGAVQRLECARRPFDVELIAGRVVERAPLVRADLRVDAERAQEAERAPSNRGAREIEMDVDAATPAQVHAARDVEEA